MGIMEDLFGGSSMPSYLENLNQQQAQYAGDQLTANQANWNNALSASQLGSSSDLQYGTATGQFLNGNPYISDIAAKTTQDIMDSYNSSYIPQALSSYASSGRYGSGLMTEGLGDIQSQMNTDIGSAVNDLYYNNYNTERAYMENAASRLGQQYDPLARASQYSGIINANTTSPYMYQEQNPGILGTVGAVTGIASNIAGLFGGSSKTGG